MTNSKDVELEPLSIMGISVRTTNQNGQSQTDIGQLWERFIGENIIAKIPEKASSETYFVYTDYESDFNGAYTTIIGCRVNSTAYVPDGFTKKDIAKGKYLKVESKGRLPDCVVQSWMAIWQSTIDRSYTADFDVYGEGCNDPQNATVDIYVSIK